MIQLTRRNGESFVLNADQIELVEATPDTVISLLNGKKLLVRESVAEVVDLVLAYARRVHNIGILPSDKGGG